MADKRISQLVERVDIANNDVLPIVASGATTTNKVTISSIQDWMQDNLDVGVTSVGITLGSTGTDVNVTGSPITTSGNITINFPTASATNRGLLSAADWTTFNNKADAGNYVTLDTTQTITAQKTFTTSGSTDSVIISHGSGSGIALDITKGGNGEGIRVEKTSGSGNAVTITGGLLSAEASSFSGNIAANGGLTLAASGTADPTIFRNTSGTSSSTTGSNVIGFNSVNNIFVTTESRGGFILGFNNSVSNRTYTLQDASGTLAFTSDISSAVAGYVTLDTAQNITGSKTFTNSILLKNSALDGLILESYSPNALEIGATILGTTYYSSIVFPAGNQSWNLPNASGTIALTSNLSGYLPLTGGTLTGALNGTSASFTGDVSLSGAQNVRWGLDDGSANARSWGIRNGYNASGDFVILSSSTNNTTLNTVQLQIARTGAATFSGALNGTSAVFSGASASPVLTLANSSGGTKADFTITENTGLIINSYESSTGRSIDFRTAGTSALTLASTGAATFSSSVGVGISPSVKFQVNDGTNINLGIKVGQTDSTAVMLNAFNDAVSANIPLEFRASKFAFQNGNVGIGTASPSSKLEAYTTLGASVGINHGFDAGTYPRCSGIGLGANSTSYTVSSGGSTISFVGGAGMYAENTASSGNPTNLVFWTNLAGTPVERMRITSGGVIEVKSGNELRTYRADNTRYGTFYTDGNNVNIAASVDPISISSPSRIQFNTAGTERMRVTLEGYLHVSNDGGYIAPGSPYHQIKNTAATITLYLLNHNTVADGLLINLNTSSTDYYYFRGYSNSAESNRIIIYSNGNIQNANNSYGALSDAKLKENIQDASPKLDDLMKVKIRNYNLIGEETKQIGVIAQELEEVFPSMIDESQDYEEVEVPQLDEEGNEILNEEGEVVTIREKISKGTTTKSVKYSVFVPMLIKAIQEQQEIINEIKSEISSLKNQIK